MYIDLEEPESSITGNLETLEAVEMYVTQSDAIQDSKGKILLHLKYCILHRWYQAKTKISIYMSWSTSIFLTFVRSSPVLCGVKDNITMFDKRLGQIIL